MLSWLCEERGTEEKDEVNYFVCFIKKTKQQQQMGTYII